MADKKDIVHLGPELDGSYPYLREQHQEGQRKLSCGFLGKPRRSGEPLHGSGIIIEHRGPGPVYNVVGEFDTASTTPSKTKGPAKVATDAYRAGWDSIFGNKTVGQA